ncbi:MAG: hypothetical protein CVU03_03500 [Bacteroidetes bacterium HGW-Bacteroidetes-2]|jgi:uncharacterized short protein YbdD (DUF466 family)|nr:MAG: hypothetical protein CVU03_03500 [Bacteroidetes bacterium HGW-Bacteroidetes-2]
MERIYTIKAKNSDALLEFKYDLNGNLTQFKILEGVLSAQQMRWLFSNGNFPAIEPFMHSHWIAKLKPHFEITIGEPDLSFESFWNAYNHKVKKVMAENAWKRLSTRDKMNALAGIKSYDNYLKRKGVAKAHPSTYLNQRYWEDNYGSIH